MFGLQIGCARCRRWNSYVVESISEHSIYTKHISNDLLVNLWTIWEIAKEDRKWSHLQFGIIFVPPKFILDEANAILKNWYNWIYWKMIDSRFTCISFRLFQWSEASKRDSMIVCWMDFMFDSHFVSNIRDLVYHWTIVWSETVTHLHNHFWSAMILAIAIFSMFILNVFRIIRWWIYESSNQLNVSYENFDVFMVEDGECGFGTQLNTQNNYQ